MMIVVAVNCRDWKLGLLMAQFAGVDVVMAADRATRLFGDFHIEVGSIYI